LTIPGSSAAIGLTQNAGILVFQRIIAILILSSIPPVAGPLISPRRRRYPYEPEANIALSSPRRRLSEPEAKIPLFHHFYPVKLFFISLGPCGLPVE